MRIPARREFGAAIRHVSPAEHTQLQHLFWREFGSKLRIEMPADRLGPVIHVAALHSIVHHDFPFHVEIGSFHTMRGDAVGQYHGVP